MWFLELALAQHFHPQCWGLKWVPPFLYHQKDPHNTIWARWGPKRRKDPRVACGFIFFGGGAHLHISSIEYPSCNNSIFHQTRRSMYHLHEKIILNLRDHGANRTYRIYNMYIYINTLPETNVASAYLSLGADPSCFRYALFSQVGWILVSGRVRPSWKAECPGPSTIIWDGHPRYRIPRRPSLH